MKIARPFEPLQIVPPFFLELARLDQQEPACRRQVVGEVLAIVVARVEHRDVDRVERRQAALRGDFEAADRFDLVAEQLDPHRIVPVGGEDIDDAAARRELARQLDGRRVLKPMLDQPAQQLLHVQRVAAPSCRVCRPAARRAPAATGSGCW